MRRAHDPARIALVAALFVWFASGAEALPDWYVAGVEGTAEVKQPGPDAPAPAAVDQRLSSRDNVVTSSGSKLKIVLEDVADVAMGQETYFVIRGVTEERATLEARRGKARIAKSPDSARQLRVRTSAAVLVVYGTVVEMEFDDDSDAPRTLACNTTGRVEVGLPETDELRPIPSGLCIDAFAGSLSDPMPAPEGFVPLGPGPSAGVSATATDLLLFGATGVAAPLAGIEVGRLCTDFLCEDPGPFVEQDPWDQVFDQPIKLNLPMESDGSFSIGGPEVPSQP